MASTSGQPRVWSLWIYDRHCSLLFHADWSIFHNRNTLANTSSFTAGSTATTNTGGSSTLSLSEQSKLVYGVVFSLRNMTRKFSPLENTTNNGSTLSSSSVKETFHSFSTSTYSLSHLQTPTNYTFILMTDPIAPPTRRPPQSSSSSNNNNSSLSSLGFSSSATSFSGGGGIPSTGGMSTTGVLSQIARGPWIEFVARNAACFALERLDNDDDDDDDDGYGNGISDELKEVEELREQKKKLKEKELQKQRMTGIGKSIDSEAFKAAVERVLAQNKLNAPRM